MITLIQHQEVICGPDGTERQGVEQVGQGNLNWHGINRRKLTGTVLLNHTSNWMFRDGYIIGNMCHHETESPTGSKGGN